MGRHMNTVEQTEIWDRYEAGLVELQMNEYADQLARRMAAAQRYWEEELMAITEYALMRETLEADFVRANSWDPAVQWLPCPVCELPASLFGELEPEADWDYSGRRKLYSWCLLRVRTHRRPLRDLRAEPRLQGPGRAVGSSRAMAPRRRGPPSMGGAALGTRLLATARPYGSVWAGDREADPYYPVGAVENPKGCA